MRVILLGIMVAVAAITPATASADDQQIADFIKARLVQEKQQGNLVGFNVDMRVDRGTVWFKGFVSNRAQELLILRTAQLAGHLGVVQVVDDIDVNGGYQQASTQAAQPMQPEKMMPMQQAMPNQTMQNQAMQNQAMQNQAMQNQAMMAQQRIAQRPMQPVMNPNYQMPTAGQPRPLQPQQSYIQPQMQRQPAKAEATGPRMPYMQTPRAPQRMEMPMSSREPKPDTNTQAVAYQEPISPMRMQGMPQNGAFNTPIQNSLAPNTLPSFQQNLMNTRTPASTVSARQPIAAPPTPMASQPLAFARAQNCEAGCGVGGPMVSGDGYYGGGAGITSESASLPGYAWPSYAAHPNYGAVSYPKQYSASAWPYIGPFYPYPQVPLGWRKVALEWDDGWWFLDFSDK